MSSLVKYVDHTYRDYSRYIEDGGELIRHKKSNNNFTARLHRVLSHPQNSAVITWMVSDTSCVSILLNTNWFCLCGRYCYCFEWFYSSRFSYTHSSTAHILTLQQPHGRAFKILSKEKLITDVLPNYYVCKKYESFSRQLNGWGFKRLHQSGPGTYPLRGL